MSIDKSFDCKYVVNPITNCWEWSAHKINTGYGQINRCGRRLLAHRYSYEIHKGPIPEGLRLDHLCNNRMCVNPDHLEPVTAKENSNRSKLLKETSSVIGKKVCRKTGLRNRKHPLPEGVIPRDKKFRARIWWGGKQMYLGTFSTPEDASQAYIDFRTKNNLPVSPQ